MRVYYEMKPTGTDAIDYYLRVLFEMYRFRLMWYLRHLEQEINDEGGCLIIVAETDRSYIHTKDFTRGLTEKVTAIIKEIDMNEFNLCNIIK